MTEIPFIHIQVSGPGGLGKTRAIEHMLFALAGAGFDVIPMRDGVATAPGLRCLLANGPRAMRPVVITEVIKNVTPEDVIAGIQKA